MAEDAGALAPQEARRGMATVAVLKLNFDAGRDHLSMFEPFVLDTVSRVEGEEFDAETARADLLARHELATPLSTLHTLLSRLRKKGFLRQSGTHYFRTNKVIVLDDLRLRREQVESRQQRLAASFSDYAARRGLIFATSDDALALILEFVERHHVSLALGDVSQTIPRVPEEDLEQQPLDRRTLIVAEFIQNAIFEDGENAEILQEFLEGFVLHNALLLKDISLAGRRYDTLRVIFDSSLLFAALGVRGEAEEVAVKEFTSLLRETGAITEVLEPTVEEMRRILRVYEEKIGTAAGRLQLFATPMTRFFVTRKYSPSDIRSFEALLEKNLKGLGFSIRELPKHKEHLTLDESALGKQLAEGPGSENEPRVVHDVNCVAAVLTLRGGRTAHSLEKAGAIFVSTSGMTIRSVAKWYQEQGRSDIPPIIHYLALSNHAWLKKPAYAARLKVHELVALCAAALRPSRQAWDVFLRYLRRLQDSDELSSDEVTSILVSELTDELIVAEEIDDDAPAELLSEVVERVQATYRSADNEAAKQAQKAVLAIRASVERRARAVARIVCWTLALLLAAGTFAGAFITLAGLHSGSHVTGVRFVFAALFVVIGLMSLLWGFHLNHWRTLLEERLTKLLRTWFSGEEGDLPPSQ